ncbi:MAG: Rieske 2Fe-2S domain-containing protein [Planctomycetaceae bacterium]|nr:Rieske 2Fe-2S domain-containing protein [Planctomycetaceae bacterium]MCP4776679.1 Rieske 2Fe-2S domain-containing protein [Planctomycetaceae bacterium]
MTDFITVAKLGDIPDGEGKAYKYNSRMVAVFNQKGQYHAIDDMCPHMGASLASGHLEECTVVCPWHSWSFDIRDGAWCENRRINIDVYQVRIVGDDIQIAASEKPKGDDSETSPTSNPDGSSNDRN